MMIWLPRAIYAVGDVGRLAFMRGAHPQFHRVLTAKTTITWPWFASIRAAAMVRYYVRRAP